MASFRNHLGLCIVAFCALVLLRPTPTDGGAAEKSNRESIPYIPMRQDVVNDLLGLAGVRTNDVVYDLGSGDGRVVVAAARDFGACKAVGIELEAELVSQSREQAARAGVSNRVHIIHGDLFTNDLSEASVIVLYLGNSANLRLRPKLLRELQPGARIVSHQFGMGEWPPEKHLSVRTVYHGMFGRMFNPFANNPCVPDFELNPDITSKACIAQWIVPAKVAGTWKGECDLQGGQAQLNLELHQTLQKVTGSFSFRSAETNFEGMLDADLWGGHLRLEGHAAGQPFFGCAIRFDGRIEGDTLRGQLEFLGRTEPKKAQCSARRQPGDFSGIWKWSGPGPAPLMMEIRRKNGRMGATLSHRERQYRIDDFYDFGGGFYFTHMFGRVETSPGVWGLELTEDAGWLVGEAIGDDQGLAGTLWWFPHPEAERAPGSMPPKESPGTWRPTRVAH